MQKISAPNILGDFVSYDSSRYEDVDLTGLAAFALHALNQRNIATTFENVVVTAFRLFPAKFALEGYPEYPDAARINRTLLQLTPKYRNWARGSVQKGFVLTESGLAKVEGVRLMLEGQKSVIRDRSKSNLPRTMDLSKELAPLEQSSLFQKWKEGKLTDGTTLEFLDLTGAYAYTPAHVLRERINSLENAARQVGRADIIEFLRDVRREFVSKVKDSTEG
jgi:hypothetical protein